MRKAAFKDFFNGLLGHLVLLVSIADQRSPEDVAWFDEIEVYHVP